MHYSYLLFKHVEVVYDNTDEKVQSEEGSADDEDDEVEVIVDGRLPRRLQIHFPRVHRIRHDFHPSFECCLRSRKKRSIINY